jgi:hypothetical protein
MEFLGVQKSAASMEKAGGHCNVTGLRCRAFNVFKQEFSPCFNRFFALLYVPLGRRAKIGIALDL